MKASRHNMHADGLVELNRFGCSLDDGVRAIERDLTPGASCGTSRSGPSWRPVDMRLYDYAASGNCYKVRLALALLDRPYERVAVDLFAGDTLTDAFAALNPLRETPVLELDDGTVLTQSPAILWLLAENTWLLPGRSLARAQVVQWLAFEQERVMSGIGGARFRLVTGRARAEDPLVAGRLQLAREALDALASHLVDHDWLVGDSATIADIAVFAYTSRAADIDLDATDRPPIATWLDRVRALPGFIDDFAPYPPNARPGAGTSIYD